MSRPKALISWSSGKDSAFALHEVRRAGEFEVVGALTTVTETLAGYRSTASGRKSCRRNAKPPVCRNGLCRFPIRARTRSTRRAWGTAVAQAVADGVTHMIFGDLFLADIRAYREQKLAGTRNHAGVSAVGSADARIRAGDDRKRAGSLSCHSRYEEVAGTVRGPQIRCAIARRFARRHRSLRRERRVSYLRGGGADVYASARGETPASASSATVMPIAISCSRGIRNPLVPAFARTTMRLNLTTAASAPSDPARR